MVKKILLLLVSVIAILAIFVLLSLNTGLVKEVGKIKNKIHLSISKTLFEEENGQTKEIGNIFFKYKKNQESLKAIDAAIISLNQNKKLLHEIFGNEISNPISIVLVKDPSEFQDLFGLTGDGYVAGTFVYEKKSIFIAVPKNKKEMEQFKRTIIHEYTHYLITSKLDMAGLNVSVWPVWFHEGLAAYIERKGLGLTSEDIESIETINFKKLETHEQWIEHLRSPYNPYLQSRVLVGLLLKDEGNSAINKLIKDCKDNNFDAAFEQTAGKPLSLYQSETLTSLNQFHSRLLKGRGQLNRDKNPETALKIAKELNDSLPNVRDVLLLLSKIYLEMGDYDQSIKYDQQIVNLFPNSVYYQGLADALLFKDLDKAIESAKSAVNLADKADVGLYQKYLDQLNNIKESVEINHSLSGYVTYLSDETFLSNKNKIDLINIILGRYPDLEDRGELISLRQSFQKARGS